MIAGHHMTNEQVARFANTILAQEAHLSDEEWRVVRDCEVLLGEASSTDDHTVVRARVRAAFSARHAEADLDGVLHVAGACCGEGAIGRPCRREGCGGRIHVQPLHRGRQGVCERCEADRGHWRPRGYYLTDRMIGGFGVERSSVFGEVGGAAEILELLARASSSGRASDGAAVDVAAWLSGHAEDPGVHAVREFLRACEHRRTVARTSSGEEVRVGDLVRWDPDVFRRVDGEVTQIRNGQVWMVRMFDAVGPWSPTLLLGEQVALEFSADDGRLRGRLRRIPRPTPPAPTSTPIAPGSLAATPVLWFVTARHRDTDRMRRWVVVAACLAQAYDRVAEALRASPTSLSRREDYDGWRAWPVTSRLAVEVGAGGDVPVSGLS